MANYTMTMGSYDAPPPEADRGESAQSTSEESATEFALLETLRQLFAGSSND